MKNEGRKMKVEENKRIHNIADNYYIETVSGNWYKIKLASEDETIEALSKLVETDSATFSEIVMRKLKTELHQNS